MKLAYSMVLLAAVALAGCNTSCPPDCGCVSHDDILNYYEVDVKAFSKKVEDAFVKAENDVLNLPAPDVTPDGGPHPDVDKCPCKGSGKIRHGDGHYTPCPYHSGDFGAKSKTPNLIVEDGVVTYYNK